MLRTRSSKFAALILGLIAIAACIGCQSDKLTTIVLSGRALFPPEFTGLGEQVPVANTDFAVLDLSLPGDSNVVAVGVTDIAGNYFTRINATPSVAVVVLGAVRVSGLIDTTSSFVEKAFDGITDVACEAGVTAIGEGKIFPFEMDAERISNLEAGAFMAVQQIAVDYTDSDGSRTAAVNLTRQLTDDGAHPPL
ncbi:MAG: hypothetical protein KDD66_04080 [Bdellovibrionales bacterium]|nr:hypothetical protein [Bdellovibrionales bacterium]